MCGCYEVLGRLAVWRIVDWSRSLRLYGGTVVCSSRGFLFVVMSVYPSVGVLRLLMSLSSGLNIVSEVVSSMFLLMMRPSNLRCLYISMFSSMLSLRPFCCGWMSVMHFVMLVSSCPWSYTWFA